MPSQFQSSPGSRRAVTHTPIPPPSASSPTHPHPDTVTTHPVRGISSPSLPVTGKRHPPDTGSITKRIRLGSESPPVIDLARYIRKPSRRFNQSSSSSSASRPVDQAITSIPPASDQLKHPRKTYLPSPVSAPEAARWHTEELSGSDAEDDENEERQADKSGGGEQEKDEEMAVEDELKREEDEEEDEHEAPEEDKKEANEYDSGTDEEKKKNEEAGAADEEDAHMSVDLFQNDHTIESYPNFNRSKDNNTGDSKQEPDGNNGNLFRPFREEILDELYDEMVNSPENATATRRDLAVLMMLVRDVRKNRNSSPRIANRGPRSPSPLGPPYPQHKPKLFDIRRQSDDMLQLNLEVRAYCNEKMGLSEHPIKVPQTGAYIERFNNTKKEQDGPKLEEDPHLDLASGGLSSDWKKCAASVFAKDFIANAKSSCKDEKVVQSAFRVHLKALRLRSLKQAREQAREQQGESDSDGDAKYNSGVADKRTSGSRRIRRRLLLQRRKAITTTYNSDPSIQRASRVLDMMSYEAMSGDESMRESDQVSYAITTLGWRNPSKEVISWFRSLDALHLSTRFTLNDQPRQGGFPRPRIKSQRIEQADAPAPGLPRNFYNLSWLETLGQSELESLDIKDPIDLSFSPEMTYIASRFAEVKTRKCSPLPRNHPSLLSLKDKSPRR